MAKNCSIIEDLLPLYIEGLVQDETAEWLESHLTSCSQCAELKKLASEDVFVEKIPSTIAHDKMMNKINQKISIYQLIFIGISFFLAIKTSLLNESFGFILSYAILGLISFLFYRNVKIILLITFIPIFIWSLFSNSSTIHDGFSIQLLNMITSSIVLAVVHLLFALIGALIGHLILKMKENEG